MERIYLETVTFFGVDASKPEGTGFLNASRAMEPVEAQGQDRQSRSA
jgi:hypothetical protein